MSPGVVLGQQIGCGAIPAHPQAPKEVEVHCAELDETTKGLRALAEHLLDRLGPVLIQNEPKAGEASGARQPANCQLASLLQSNVAHLQITGDILKSIANRLQL